MKQLVRTLMIPVLLFAAAVGLPGPALAAASFTWSFTGDYGIYSRDFSQTRERDIYVKIRSWSPCKVEGDEVTVLVDLYKDDTFDNRVGATKKVDCTGTAKWSKVNPGTYFFRLLIEGRHRTQGVTFRATGTTYYNGSTP